MAALRRDAVAVANPRHDLISPALDYGGAPAPALTRPTAGAADEALPASSSAGSGRSAVSTPRRRGGSWCP
ncbi:hypothetical protein JL720_17295 [Aureococcus anophagefferens]|nr:hypothetical protein JL720_17295 [Aureococcus anophagefferens]